MRFFLTAVDDRKLKVIILTCSYVILVTHPVNGRYYLGQDKEQFRHDLNNACSFEGGISIVYDIPVKCDDTLLSHQVYSSPSVRYEAVDDTPDGFEHLHMLLLINILPQLNMPRLPPKLHEKGSKVFTDKTYAIIMLTADHSDSNGDILSPYIEWVAAGNKGYDIRQGKIISSLIPYMPPGQVQDKPIMKYEVILIEERSEVSTQSYSILPRSKFDLWGFMQTNELNNVRAMSDIYVEI